MATWVRRHGSLRASQCWAPPIGSEECFARKMDARNLEGTGVVEGSFGSAMCKADLAPKCKPSRQPRHAHHAPSQSATYCRAPRFQNLGHRNDVVGRHSRRQRIGIEAIIHTASADGRLGVAVSGTVRTNGLLGIMGRCTSIDQHTQSMWCEAWTIKYRSWMLGWTPRSCNTAGQERVPVATKLVSATGRQTLTTEQCA